MGSTGSTGAESWFSWATGSSKGDKTDKGESGNDSKLGVDEEALLERNRRKRPEGKGPSPVTEWLPIGGSGVEVQGERDLIIDEVIAEVIKPDSVFSTQKDANTCFSHAILNTIRVCAYVLYGHHDRQWTSFSLTPEKLHEWLPDSIKDRNKMASTGFAGTASRFLRKILTNDSGPMAEVHSHQTSVPMIAAEIKRGALALAYIPSEKHMVVAVRVDEDGNFVCIDTMREGKARVRHIDPSQIGPVSTIVVSPYKFMMKEKQGQLLKVDPSKHVVRVRL